MKVVRKEFKNINELNDFLNENELYREDIINVETGKSVVLNGASDVWSCVLFYWDWTK